MCKLSGHSRHLSANVAMELDQLRSLGRAAQHAIVDTQQDFHFTTLCFYLEASFTMMSKFTSPIPSEQLIQSVMLSIIYSSIMLPL